MDTAAQDTVTMVYDVGIIKPIITISDSGRSRNKKMNKFDICQKPVKKNRNKNRATTQSWCGVIGRTE